jgi:hypothetical protein
MIAMAIRDMRLIQTRPTIGGFQVRDVNVGKAFGCPYYLNG